MARVIVYTRGPSTSETDVKGKKDPEFEGGHGHVGKHCLQETNKTKLVAT